MATATIASSEVKATTLMANEKQKNEGPTCACGRVDLYEEWLKQNEKAKKEEISSTADNGDTKAVPTKN